MWTTGVQNSSLRQDNVGSLRNLQRLHRLLCSQGRWRVEAKMAPILACCVTTHRHCRVNMSLSSSWIIRAEALEEPWMRHGGPSQGVV